MSEAMAEEDILYEPHIYVAGQTPKSPATIANPRKNCELNFRSKYRIVVIDVLATPQLAKGDRIVAVPTLVLTLPAPIRKVIGDLSDNEKVQIGPDLRRSDGQKG